MIKKKEIVISLRANVEPTGGCNMVDYAEPICLVQICLHVEPYKDRNPENFRENLKYVYDTYGKHPAYYKVRKIDESQKEQMQK